MRLFSYFKIQNTFFEQTVDNVQRMIIEGIRVR